MIKESTYIAFIIIDFFEEDEAFDNLSFYCINFYIISEKLYTLRNIIIFYVSSDTNMYIINVQIDLWMKMIFVIFFCADEWINWMNDIFHNVNLSFVKVLKWTSLFTDRFFVKGGGHKEFELVTKNKKIYNSSFYKRKIYFLINLLLDLQFFAIQVISVSLCHNQRRKNECVLFFIKPKISVIERIWHVRARHETFSLERGDKDIHLLKLVFVLSPKWNVKENFE